MNLNTKGKEKLMSYGCADTSVSDIGNEIYEVSWNERKVTLVGFDYVL